MRVLELTTGNSERLGRKERPRIEPGTGGAHTVPDYLSTLSSTVEKPLETRVNPLFEQHQHVMLLKTVHSSQNYEKFEILRVDNQLPHRK